MTITSIANWFRKAKPVATPKDQNTQIGVMVEELAEGLRQLKGINLDSEEALLAYTVIIEDFAKKLKLGVIRTELPPANRVEFLDAMGDVIVTAVGSANYHNLNIEAGLAEIDESNWSKFDKNGNPIFDEVSRKILKGPNYRKPDLNRFV